MQRMNDSQKLGCTSSNPPSQSPIQNRKSNPMSIFDKTRLTNETFKLDIERMRRGWYSDKYFENIGRMLTTLASEGYTYSGQNHNLPAELSSENIAVGDIEVEMQWFTRRVG